jgi:putative redox protein
LANSLTARHHTLVADEPQDRGGADSGPTPQELLALSLASCTAVTLEMYAARKDWDVGKLEVDVDYEPPERGSSAHFDVVIKLPVELAKDQLERLKVIARKCPVHRTLKGAVEIRDRVEMV